MSELLIQPITSALVDIISNSPTQRVLGARLGALLKAAIPDFSPLRFSSRTLRDFIKTHVPEVEEKGRSGPDLLYGFATNPSPHQTSFPVPTTGALYVPPPTTAFNWRAFTNPSYPYALAANTETGDFRVIPLGVNLPAPWVLLPKPTSDDHLAIARAFISTLDEAQRASLEPLLKETKWFVSFSAAAKALNLANAWGAFRTSQLRTRFEEALEESRVPASTVPSATSLKSANLPVSTNMTEDRSDVRLRGIVSQLVAEMPLDQLRELRLPVGRVFDLLLNR